MGGMLGNGAETDNGVGIYDAEPPYVLPRSDVKLGEPHLQRHPGRPLGVQRSGVFRWRVGGDGDVERRWVDGARSVVDRTSGPTPALGVHGARLGTR